jgi:hypothetical protein
MKTSSICRIKVSPASLVIVERVYPQLGHIRVEGWITAPNRAAGFDADRAVGERLGIGFVNSCAYGTSETGPVNMPFSFDIQPAWHPDFPRREEMAEAYERVMRDLRSARHHFSRNRDKL